MNLQNITSFLAIVRTGTISKAAQELYLTQSAVSHRLKALEDEVGATLVVRRQGHQCITLTNKGEEFIPIAERWLALLKDTEQLVLREERCPLVIASVDSLNIYLLPPLYQKLMQQQELKLSLRIRTQQSNEIYALLDKQEVDIGFALRPILLKNIHTEIIMREQMVLIKRSRNKIITPPPVISVQELNVAKEFFIDWSLAFRLWHERCWPGVARPKLHVDTAALILQLMEDADGWSIIPLSMAREFQKTHRYQIYFIEEEPPERVIYKLTNKHPKPGSVQAIALVEKYLAKFLAAYSLEK